MKSLVLISLFLSVAAFAAPSKEMKTKESATKESATNYNFEDLLVQGKYHFSEEAVTTVEEDKVLDSLIGVRTDFKDRLKSSTGSY
ncbi:MAG: hypothetical protein ACXVB4_08210 [Pseudobdellovibrionaceae bacterium]